MGWPWFKPLQLWGRPATGIPDHEIWGSETTVAATRSFIKSHYRKLAAGKGNAYHATTYCQHYFPQQHGCGCRNRTATEVGAVCFQRHTNKIQYRAGKFCRSDSGAIQ